MSYRINVCFLLVWIFVWLLNAGCSKSELINIGGGRSIYMECSGSGAPTVILVTGLGERADDWMAASKSPNVFEGVSAFSRVCAYDRPGTAKQTENGWEPSRSTPVAKPATIADSAVDLDTLLAASGETAPYVLVGHSLGGPIIRLYASAHPSKVAGFIFDDALSENLGDGLTSEQLTNFEKLNDPVIQGRPVGSEETFYSNAVVPLLKAASPAPTVPTIVLTADTWMITPEAIASGEFPSFVDQAFADALWAAQLAAQDKFAALFKDAKHVTHTNAGHYIHRDQPQLVIDSIREVVEQVRSR